MPFIFPASADLMLIEPELLPTIEADNPIFQIMPTRDVDAAEVIWDQEDNYTGLQQARGLGGDPVRVKRTGYNRFKMEPGVYGEFMRLDERELVELRAPGTFASPINVVGQVGRDHLRLLIREKQRIAQIGWTLITSGTFAIFAMNAAAGTTQIVHTDSYPIQIYTAPVSWSSPATATPLLDLRSVQLLARGYSMMFDSSAKLYMNQLTFNKLISNTNSADLYGRRTAGLATINGLGRLNELLTEDNLPNIVIYDGNFRDDNNAVQLYIKDNTAVLIGKRASGAPIGEYQFVRNANNPDMAPGAYTMVVDRLEQGPPRTIDTHRGHSGGPALHHPAAVVVFNV